MTSDWRPFDPAPEPASTFRGPSIDGLLEALLGTVEAAVDVAAPTRALQLEVWADRIAAHLFERESQTAELHRELARALLASPHPLAPGVLAALALVLSEQTAAALREARDELRSTAAAGLRDGADLLGIGEVEPDGSAEIVELADGWELVVGITQPGCPHSVGIVVDAEQDVVDCFVGPPLGEASGAGPTSDALAARLDAVALDPEALDDDALQIWRLVARRLQSVIG